MQPGVTHVVASKDGTDKAKEARKIPGCLLVKASWLVESYWSMTRQDVRQHLLGEKADSAAMLQRLEQHEEKMKQIRQQIEQQPLKASTADNSVTSSSDGDSDDDDLAAELENEMMNM